MKNNSDWGDGEFLLMCTSFELDKVDCESYRLSILARQGFDVYLNGHKIHTYIWWKTQPYYRAIMLTENETRCLKKGRNFLAVYANVHYERQTAEPYGSIDLFIEGITAEDRKRHMQALEQVFSAEDRAIANGASNAGYHYMGSRRSWPRSVRPSPRPLIRSAPLQGTPPSGLFTAARSMFPGSNAKSMIPGLPLVVRAHWLSRRK